MGGGLVIIATGALIAAGAPLVGRYRLRWYPRKHDPLMAEGWSQLDGVFRLGRLELRAMGVITILIGCGAVVAHA